VYVFLSGAEMQPERVRADWPVGRFVARGRVEPRPVGAAPLPGETHDETWGIVIETPDDAVEGEPRSAVADDGRIFAVVVTAPDAADPTAVLAAARYWELPPIYVRRLMRLANAQIEEYVY
jgi:hypothetical protein